MKTLKEMVEPGKQVKFMYYREGELWYTTDDGFDFPVPINDCGNGVFLDKDKAILFMRYIRKHLETINSARELQKNNIGKMDVVNQEGKVIGSQG